MDFDYIVVGGGTAGAVLASRLSEERALSICLIEAGGRGALGLTGWRQRFAALWPFGGAPQYRSVPQVALGGRQLDFPSGAGIGGSFGAGGGPLYLRGHPEDYAAWEALGAEGWDWPGCLPGFLRAEANARGASGLHAADGALPVADPGPPSELATAFLSACEADGIALFEDFNARPFEGAGQFQPLAHPDGRSSGPADYLHPALGRDNLRLMTGCRVDRVELEEGRAIGLRAGRRRFRARREILLTAGAIGTPLLLLRSGIGSADAPGDRAPRHALPGLGRMLKMQAALTLELLPRPGAALPPRPFLEAGALLRSDPHLARPDLRLELLAGPGQLCARLVLMRPASSGRLALSPRGEALIDPCCLAAEADRVALRRGFRRLAALCAMPQLAPWCSEGPPSRLVEPPEAGLTAASMPVGACRMGQDDLAVCEPSLRLRGLEGIRIADASVMPDLPAGEPGLAGVMIAERAAELIRNDP